MFSGLLLGAMLPYWFSAMTMKSVGKAALAMVHEVRRQFNTIAGELRALGLGAGARVRAGRLQYCTAMVPAQLRALPCAA